MSGHPRHGTKPQAAKLRVAAQFDGSNVLKLWKLRRLNPATGKPEIHPTAGGLGPTWTSTASFARATAGQYPGWELVPA